MLAARLQLPFSRRLAWPTFSVRIAEAEALADPIGIVRKVPPPSAPPPPQPTLSRPASLASPLARAASHPWRVAAIPTVPYRRCRLYLLY